MFPPVFPLLVDFAPVTDLVGVPPNARIYEAEAPQSPVAPYIVWLLVDGVPENSLDERATTDRLTFQVDCYHATLLGMRQLAQAVRDALEPKCSMTGVVAHERGATEPRLYRIGLQFDYWLIR